jgi:hypothetical protein
MKERKKEGECGGKDGDREGKGGEGRKEDSNSLYLVTNIAYLQ